MRLIREQMSSMISEACAASGTRSEDIGYIAVAANTIMQHIIAGYSPVAMGAAPFPPVSLFGEEMPAWEGLSAAGNASVYYTPAISAYVGGDITAGLLAAGFEDVAQPAIFLDIGTNGEIVLKNKGVYYCCATAAGPAFEGAEITMGMAAESGAIDHVRREAQGDGSLVFSVIGGGAPRGLCGSGLLDLLAVLLETGEVDETGRLRGNDKFRLTSANVDGTAFADVSIDGDTLAGEGSGVYITAGDVRKLQLAKAAIAAGIQVLLHYAGISETEVKSLALAGGFGSYMDLHSAARIGLFPKNLLPVAKTLGNTAGEGAAIALYYEDARKRLRNIRAHCEYIELSSSAFFNDKFVEQMMFRD
jgi:uncharacterized 2Fe-2S/4Fe-4S cluster protein (DUF4445 family)